MGKKYKETNLFIIISFIKTCANRRLTQPVPPQIIIWWQSCFFAVSFHFYLVILFWVFGVSLQISKWRATYFTEQSQFSWYSGIGFVGKCYQPEFICVFYLLSWMKNWLHWSISDWSRPLSSIQSSRAESRGRYCCICICICQLYFMTNIKVTKMKKYSREICQTTTQSLRGWYIHGDLRERAPPHTIFSFSDEQKKNQ